MPWALRPSPIPNFIIRVTWTKLPLDKSRFNELSAQISQSVRDWLSESNLLDEPLGAGISIESLSAEVFPVEVRRPWLNLRLFQSRSWKWDDQPLSDGGSPPQGILPAYVVGVVFARNLVIDLDTESASGDAGSLARTLTVANKEIIRRLHAFRPDVVSARPFMVANRQVARRQPISRTPIPARLLISRAVTTGPAQDTGNGAITTIDGPEGSVHSFPVPPGFRCDPIIAQASSHLQKAESELRELNQQRLTLQQQVNQLEQQVQETLGRLKGLERYGNAETITIRDHRDGRNTTIVINVKERRDRWNQDLGQSQRELAAKSASRDAETNKIKAQSEVVAQLSEALEEWKNLSQSKPEEGRMFILGFICERLPKSPDPDPQLFAA
jgi:hypothetical protein